MDEQTTLTELLCELGIGKTAADGYAEALVAEGSFDTPVAFASLTTQTIVRLAGEFQRSAIKTAVLDDEVRLQGPMVATSVSLSAMLVEAASARLVFHGNASQVRHVIRFNVLVQ